MELTVVLPTPHPRQSEVIDSDAKRKVVVFGRRGGKTMGFSILAARAMLDGRRVLYACPKHDQTEHFWDYCKGFLGVLIDNNILYKNETHRLLQMTNGGRIRAKTAHDADTLRGDYADLLLLDEFQDMNPDAWELVGAPMLLDNNGDAVFGGTPKRRNHFFALYQRAKTDETQRWKAWHFASTVNPYLSAEALAELTFDMTDEAYRQEILAEFLEGAGQVFRNIKACMNAGQSEPKDHANHSKIAGLDWGKQNDFTAVSIGCVTCHRELERDRFNKVDYIIQREKLKSLFDKWGFVPVLPERNSVGEPNIEQLLRDGIHIIPGPDGVAGFNTTGSTKPPLIENLALALERTEWQFQEDPIWTAELEAYERTISAATGRSSYSAPEGMHDDTVMARALMVWGSRGASRLPETDPHTSRFELTHEEWQEKKRKKF